MKRISLALYLPLLCLPFAIHAQEGGYIGLGAGSAMIDNNVSNWDDGSLTAGSVDDSDTGLKLFAGYRANENFALEAAYVDLGETTFSGQSNGNGFFWCTGPVYSSAEATTLSFMGIGMVPVNPHFSLHGKFGIHMWDADVTVSDACGVFKAEDDGTDLMYGLGATFYAADQFGVRLEWERFTEIMDADADFLSVSGFVRF